MWFLGGVDFKRCCPDCALSLDYFYFKRVGWVSEELSPERTCTSDQGLCDDEPR